MTSQRRRLTHSRDFDAVYRHGRAVSTTYLTLYTFPRAGDEEEEARFGLAVSRQIGKAVVRNRLKRRLREVIEELEEVQTGCDYVLVARPGLADAGEAQGPAWLREQVTEIFELARGADQGVPA